MRHLIRVYYDGQKYHGSQRQPNVLTVEGEVIKALMNTGYITTPELNKFRSASRTDKFVSAIGNVFAFNSDKNINLEQINAKVTEDNSIICWSQSVVEEDFSPKYSKWKKYWYVLPEAQIKSHLMSSVQELEVVLKKFVGKHDFSLFCKRDHRTPVREILDISLYRNHNRIIIEFKAQSFLWEQVRRIMSYVLNYKKLPEKLQNVEKLLADSDKIKDLNLKPAEPRYLILVEHFYENVIWNNNKKAVKTIRDKIIKQLLYIEKEKTLEFSIINYFNEIS
ncbi:MAG: tRNA pseudouridine(38-40) synthase TruA [Candidatus Heimdallarchaeaceae archaeon]